MPVGYQGNQLGHHDGGDDPLEPELLEPELLEPELLELELLPPTVAPLSIEALARITCPLPMPPNAVPSMCVPQLPQVAVIVTVTVDPAAAVLTSDGLSVTWYPEFCSPAPLIMLETREVTVASVAVEGAAARAPAAAAAWNVFRT